MRGMYMKNIISRLLMRIRNKNIYRKEHFPYDMQAAMAYARSVNRPVYELTESEMSKFLLKK